MMNISYIDPLLAAIRRMSAALFKPFDIGKWFTVGFSAFLAGLLDGGGGNFNWGMKDNKFDISYIEELPYTIREWVIDHQGWAIVILIGIFLLIALLVIFNWLSSRGKFIFLENVIHNNRFIRKPWAEYGPQADSLFVWRLIYGVVSFVVIFGIIAYGIYYFPELKLLSLIGIGILLLFLFIICGYVSLFLNDFIVPIMYKNRITANQAWIIFLKLLNERPAPFILYGFLIFFLIIVIVITIAILGFLTCCIGFVLIALPYIGSVILLPLSYAARAFGVQFLEQFGTAFTLFPKEEENKNPVV